MSDRQNMTVVKVDDDHVGWFEDGWYYVGWEYDNTHPSAQVLDDGRVIANESGDPELGRIHGDQILDASHEGQVMATLAAEGRVLDCDGRLLAHCDGPETPQAAAAYVLLTRRASKGNRLGALGAAMAAGTATATPPTASHEPRAPIRTEGWQPGQPYPPHLVPDPDGPGPRGLLKRGPKRAGAFRLGDRVVVQTASFQGTGEIIDISNTFERGFGTKVYPTFLVHLEPRGDRDWFNGISLRKVGQ